MANEDPQPGVRDDEWRLVDVVSFVFSVLLLSYFCWILPIN